MHATQALSATVLLLLLLVTAVPTAASDTLKPCSKDEDCSEADATCRSLNNDGRTASCIHDPVCFCLNYIWKDCLASIDCAVGEVCVSFLPNAVISFCVACDALGRVNPVPIPVDDQHVCEIPVVTPTSAPTPDPNEPVTNILNNTDPTPVSSSNETTTEKEARTDVCISANALSHLPASALVFPVHRRASVLCDVHRNCATAGHIVLYQGQPMMMRSYCTSVRGGCSRSVMLVNSPRMAWRLRVKSRSDELVFTALAGRYETVVEEMLLSRLVKAGI